MCEQHGLTAAIGADERAQVLALLTLSRMLKDESASPTGRLVDFAAAAGAGKGA